MSNCYILGYALWIFSICEYRMNIDKHRNKYFDWYTHLSETYGACLQAKQAAQRGDFFIFTR
jgi:hypothetical protein